MFRLLTLNLLLCTLYACGGGGGGSSDSTPAPAPEPTEPGSEPTSISLTDALPTTTSGPIDPGFSTLSLAHMGHSDLVTQITADCDDVTGDTIRRALLDVATDEFDQMLDHRLRCGLMENTAYTITIDGNRENGAAFRATLPFSTGVAAATGLVVLDQRSLPRDSVDDLFVGYVTGALLEELDLPGAIEALILDTILDLAEANWDNLVDPEAIFDVTTQRVSYYSRDPSGQPSAELTGVIAIPVTATGPAFVPRDHMIVLTHATGSTPGDLDLTDAWYILAAQFASRGYLVVAPDNYGRGGTDDHPETYLMANRTAVNTLDMVSQVLADTTYDAVYAGTDLTIVGYSQGGHSAVGLWQLLETQGPSGINARAVYAGGAPHNLYQTFRGVIQHLDGSCNDTDYCRYVDEDTTVPFATDRILPGFLEYTDPGLAFSDIVTGEDLKPEFISGFLANEAEYDSLKTLFQLSSFTDITSVAENFGDSGTLLHLYHSRFDRLVPRANTEELAATLSPHVTVDYHQNRCNADGYELIFNLTDKVGVLHTLCGLAVLDDAMEDLK